MAKNELSPALLRTVAFAMYLRGLEPAEIAERLGLNSDTIKWWVKAGNWAEQKQQFYAQLIDEGFANQLKRVITLEMALAEDCAERALLLSELYYKALEEPEGARYYRAFKLYLDAAIRFCALLRDLFKEALRFELGEEEEPVRGVRERAREEAWRHYIEAKGAHAK